MQLQAGDKAPDFELECLDGTTIRLADYKGKKLLLRAPLKTLVILSDREEFTIKATFCSPSHS